MTLTGLGKSHYKGITLLKVNERFNTEEKAEDRFIKQRWPNGLACPRCRSLGVARTKNRKPQPFRCRDCQKHFSVKTGTVLQNFKLSLQKWVKGFYICSRPISRTSPA